MRTNRQRTLVSTIALLSALGLGSSQAAAQQAQPSTEELLKQIKQLEQRLKSLEAQVQKQQQQPAPWSCR